MRYTLFFSQLFASTQYTVYGAKSLEIQDISVVKKSFLRRAVSA
jgi:hypothetical protein